VKIAPAHHKAHSFSDFRESFKLQLPSRTRFQCMIAPMHDRTHAVLLRLQSSILLKSFRRHSVNNMKHIEKVTLALSLLLIAILLQLFQADQLRSALAVTTTIAPQNQTSVGTFNGFDLFKVNHPPKSAIHCVGENFQEDRGYMFRSCRFDTFCFDTQLRDFVVYPYKPLNGSVYGKVRSSTHNPEEYTTVVAGSQNKRWWPAQAQEKHGIKTRIGRYQPHFVYTDDDSVPNSFYQFNATWLPFYRHQRSPYNPGEFVQILVRAQQCCLSASFISAMSAFITTPPTFYHIILQVTLCGTTFLGFTHC